MLRVKFSVKFMGIKLPVELIGVKLSDQFARVEEYSAPLKKNLCDK